jgi:XTP/dITP diphosphohydrolase
MTIDLLRDSPVRIFIATRNQGKIREFREMLGGDQFQWDDLGHHADLRAPEETGRTFRDNACLKAAYYARALKEWAVADDSGLEVDALSGGPGVHSSRWAEAHQAGKGDADNSRLLLEQLRDVPDEQRTARFVCVLALCDPAGTIIATASDAVEGRIIDSARGANGFGYDPLFLVDHLGRTTAELISDEKHKISHRGKALRRLRGLLQTIVERCP